MTIQSIVVAVHTTEADLFGAATTVITYEPRTQTYCVIWYREGEDKAVGVMTTTDLRDVLRQVQSCKPLLDGIKRWWLNRNQ